MRTGLAAGAVMLGLAAGAEATTLDLDIPASTDAASVVAAVDFPGVGAAVLRYGELFRLVPDSPIAGDAGFANLYTNPFEATYFEGASDTLGTLTYGQWVADARFIGHPFGGVEFPFIAEVTRGPIGVLYPGAADYYFTIYALGTEYFASGHVDGAGTLTTLTYSGIPEPGAWAVMLLGFGLAAARRRYWIR